MGGSGRGLFRASVVSGHVAPAGADAADAGAPLSGVGAPVVETPGELPRSRRNWGGQILFDAAKNVGPRSLEELRAAVREAPRPVRVLGKGHSFSPVCEVRGGTLISLSQYRGVLDYVPPSASNSFLGTVRFEAGATFADLCHYLSAQSPPAALKQVPSPLVVTVAGALATGTHGSGINTKAMSGHVQDIEFVDAEGELRRYERGPSGPATVVSENVAGGHVGCLGVVSRMSLDVVPYFEGRNFFIHMPLERLLRHWDELTGDLHVGGTRRPLVDSHSIIVLWDRGTCMLNAKHLLPHYNPNIACRPPAWGEHPFGDSRWILLANRAADLQGSLQDVGVEVNAGNIVVDVHAASLAAQAGVRQGWRMTRVAGRRVADKESAAQAFLTAKPPQQQARWGKRQKVPLWFEDPMVEHEKHHFDDLEHEAINTAYQAPWHDSLPEWSLDQPFDDGPDCLYGQEAEYFVPMESAVPALQAAWGVMRHWKHVGNHNLDSGIIGSSEIRSIKGCDGWVSCTPCDTVSIHLSLSPSPKVQAELWRELLDLERALAPFGARPHWGKIYTAKFWAPRFPDLYGAGFRRFKELAHKHDPAHKFVSRWIGETIFPELQ